jgi:hypothetical protein
MPVIAYKTMNLTAVWVQIRKIRCEGCHNGFRYLAIGTRNVQSSGVPLISSDDGMRERVGKQLEKALNKLSKKQRQGEGLCPHCQRYQSWMVRASRLSHYGKGLGVGGVIGALSIIPFVLMGGFGAVANLALMAGLLALGLLAGAGWGFRKSIRPGPHTGMVDHRAMKDAEFGDFMKMCKDKDYQPALTWYASIGGQFQDKVPVIPLEDYQQR